MRSLHVSEIIHPKQLKLILHEKNSYNDLTLAFVHYRWDEMGPHGRTPTINNIFLLSSLSISSYPRLGQLINGAEPTKFSSLVKLELLNCQDLAPFFEHIGSQLKELIIQTKEITAVSSFLVSSEAPLSVLCLTCCYGQEHMEVAQPQLLSCVGKFSNTLRWLHLDASNDGTSLALQSDSWHKIMDDLPLSRLRGLGLRIGRRNSDLKVSIIN